MGTERNPITKPAVAQVLRDYRKQYAQHPFATAGAFLLPAIGTILVFYIPPLIIGKLVDLFIVHGIDLAAAWPYIGWFGGLWLIGEGLWRYGMYLLVAIETKAMDNIYNLSFERLADRDYDFYANNFVGTLTKKAVAFARSFETFSDTMVFNITTNIFPLVFVFVVLSRYSIWLSAILFGSFIVMIAISIPIIRRRSKLVAARHEAGSNLVGRLSDAISNILAVKSFAKEKQERLVFKRFVNDFTSKFKKAADYHVLRFDLAVSPVYVAANVVGLAAAIFFAHTLSLQPGTIVIVFAYYSQATRIFWEINHTYRNIESSISEAAEFTQLTLEPAKIQDVANARRLRVTKGGIVFADAYFGYGGSDSPKDAFIENFQLTIKPGEKVGLVGPSGGGKTTITKLLLRFVDLNSGAILIDDQDISRVTQSSLRGSIAYVPQEPLLFHRSLFENIAYGNEKATLSDVRRAAKLAHADEFIRQLPNGYETLVGERGIKLSGGQRQRVAIARALLKDSRILVLDEATSALDSESEKYIQDGLRTLMRNKTALVIAHRLSTIKHLDRIVVLDKGTIVQDGTHGELIKQPGLYATLWGHQSGEFL